MTGDVVRSGGVAGDVLEPADGGWAGGFAVLVVGFSVVGPAGGGGSTETGSFRRDGGSGVASGGGSTGWAAGVRA
jgi:hypothetical protein